MSQIKALVSEQVNEFDEIDFKGGIHMATAINTIGDGI